MTSETPDAQTSAGEADVAPEVPMATNGDRVPMVEVIEHLLTNLDDAVLPLDVGGADEARSERDRLATQVRHHLLPRLRQVAAPVIVVVGGSTGAGKSTIVNSVVAKEVTTSGVLRPTTREPILVVHPKDADLLEGHPVTGIAAVSPDEVVPRGMALLDAPDLDSVHAANRGLADELVELADLWVFVTTGSRYGDAVPWSRLHSAHERGVSLAVVLNRVDPEALRTVRRDLFERLDGQGFGSVPFFVIPDVGPHEGILPDDRIREFTQWLTVLGAKSQSRSIIARTVRGAWPALRQDVQAVAGALEDQRRDHVSLQNAVKSATASAASEVAADVEAGTAAIGAPTTSWLADASSGGVLAPLVAAPANLVESWRFRRSATARRAAVSSLRDVSLHAARILVGDACERAERAVRERLQRSPSGAQLDALVATGDSSTARKERLQVLFEEWHEVAAELCQTLSFGKDDAGLDPEATISLVEIAAVGLDGAQRAVTRLLSDRGTVVVTRMRSDLATWAQVAVDNEADIFLSSLADLGVDDGAARSLRLRASELKGYL